MFRRIQKFSHDHRLLTLVGALVLSTILSLGLHLVRIARTGSNPYAFFPWDLFLAWLPMLAALAAYNLHRRKLSRRGWAVVIALAAFWLLFMPNAPYLVTEFINLRRGFPGGGQFGGGQFNATPQPGAGPRFAGGGDFGPGGDFLAFASNGLPQWYDILLFVAFAWTGVFLGIASLFLMQEVVREIRGRMAGWLFALIALALTSFGIYLGRFIRLNSWDVILNPLRLLRGVAGSALRPDTYLFTAVFGCFIISTYLMFMAMMNFHHDRTETSALQPPAANK